MGRNDMTFEGDIASLNEHFFFEEFTYSTNTFRPSASTELELADSIIWLDDMLVIFQLKERDKISKTSPEQEAKWFDKKGHWSRHKTSSRLCEVPGCSPKHSASEP